MGLESELRNEIEKWTKRIENDIKKVKIKDKENEHFLSNIKAYVKDSRYFLEKGDLIRAFEAVIWSWANVELGLQLGILKQVPITNHGNHAE